MASGKLDTVTSQSWTVAGPRLDNAHIAIFQQMNSQISDRDENRYCLTDSRHASGRRDLQRIPIWNPQALHELEAIGGEPLAAKVARQCVIDGEGHIHKILTSGSDRAWRESAHALHGIALSVGAVRLSTLLEATLAGQEATADRWMSQLAEAFDDLRQVLARRFP